ncbi:MAG: hypothetical protein V7754_12050 [Halioglobus sp.]
MVKKKFSLNPGALWLCVFWGATLTFAALLLRHHYFIVSATIPLDLYEGTMPFITGIIADGHNPYTREFQPIATDVYPPLYNILVAPLTHIFGNTLLLHRLIAALFIAVACLLCTLACYRKSLSWTYSLAAGITLYAGLIFYSTPVASTNALGTALFIASVVVPWLAGFNTRSLIFACCCGLLSFYTKQYFILGMAMLCLYMFLYISVIRALVTGAAFALAMTVCLALVHKTSPYFIDNTILSPVLALGGLKMWSMVSLQLVKFLQIYAGILIILLAVLASFLINNGTSGTLTWLREQLAWNGFSLTKPLLAQRVDFFSFCFFWSSLAFIAYMGRNPGNYMTYAFQLISPFFLVMAFTQISRLRRPLVALLPFIFLTYQQAYAFLPRDFSYDEEAWKYIDSLIVQEDEILATQMLLMNLLDNDKKIYQDGQTSYFPLAAEKPRWLDKAEPEDEVQAVWAQYMSMLYQKVAAGEFDLIIISPWEMRGIFLRNPPADSALDGKEYLKKYYYVDEKIPLSMTDRQGGGTYQLQIWRPRKHRD